MINVHVYKVTGLYAGFTLTAIAPGITGLLVLLSLLFSCQKERPGETDETILVKIGDLVTISKNEFIRRAEYTIRPPYAKHNSYIHKKIILNSLIAEKLFAIQESDSSDLLKSEGFLAFLKGRREQAMRQWMHHQEATAQVQVDSSELKQFYPHAGREYQIRYFSFSDSALFRIAGEAINSGIFDFDEFYRFLYGNTTIPSRKVQWHDSEDIKILMALFGDDRKMGETLQPIVVDYNDFLFIQIEGWTDDLAITQNQVQNRFQKISETIARDKTAQIWNKKVAEIMKGKTIEFVPSTFKELIEIFFRLYFVTDEEKKESLKESIWDLELEEDKPISDHFFEDILDRPFFTIDQKTWTVNDFRKALMSHPLVFRKRKMTSGEFPEQFRLAMVDLIRDHYVTQVAYEKKYDQVSVVKRNEQMWRDAYLALHHRNKYLRAIRENKHFEKEYARVLNEHLNAYVIALQQKYYKRVQLNFEEFENIHLSSIDLYVKQVNQPYQHVVPRFPILTTENNIAYITRMRD